ncbi:MULTISPECIES: arsenical pump-driving ATPase [unclassified Luteococcus]|uniref:arsenical pump-driving ATPase n=1 Tax=unclassified Luteococcus TaxID=2639923 RepID=UPI00313E6E26
MLHFLDNPPRHLFFTGKGGVGKTSVACATALHLARSGRRVLLVSTDPASNVGQVFGVAIGNRITPIPDVPDLDALEIDPQQAADAYRSKILAPVRAVLPASALAEITEQLSGSCTTEVASFNEFTSLLADPAATAGYDHVVFDTAPTGHTIRLLQLPGEWTDYLDAGKGDASCLGPLSGLEKSRATYRNAVAALADASRTRLVLVSRAQHSTLDEVARTQQELAELGIHATHLVVNGVLPELASAEAPDPLHRAIREREQAALAQLTGPLASLPRDLIELKPVNMMGPAALDSLLSTAAPESSVPEHPPTAEPVEASSLRTLVDEVESQGHGLVMAMGKGGVGKTTVAAAIAVELARRGNDVLLTTTDPAAHLSTALPDQLPRLEVSAIDPQAAIAAYRQQVMRTKGASLDDAGRAALAEDLKSPCTEEIAVFQQFSRAVNQARHRFVVMDTAPTGHTLLLMDATGSYHREITRHLDQTQAARMTTPLMRLQDPELTKVIVVTLPETTPVLEARGLAEELERAGIRPWAWVVNNSLAKAEPHSPLLAQRARNEQALLAEVDRRASRMAVLASQTAEPVGVDALVALLD